MKTEEQRRICQKYQAGFLESLPQEKLGIAVETIGQLPINGLRHKPEESTCGWYIWCGEGFSDAPDFFKPLHVGHVTDYLPEVEEFLGLEPGYRFLLAGEHVDVWRDPKLIDL